MVFWGKCVKNLSNDPCNAKTHLKSKTSEEISKATGEFGIPGFKWPI